MRFLKTFVCALLLLTTPTFLVYPQAPVPMMALRMPDKEQFFTYDQILGLLDEIENDELEDTCSDEELNQINHFLVKLAKEGLLPGDIEEEISLKEDIQNLLWGEEDHSEYSILPAIYYGDTQIIPCKGWVKKKWQKTKKFVKKHKRAIIIGAVVVVAATVIICAVASTAGAAAAAGAAASKDKKKPEPKEEEKPEEPSAALSILDETPILQSALSEQISTFKELLEEDVVFQSLDPDTQKDPTLIEKVREVGALLAHETVDGLSELVSVVPGLLQELKEVAEKISLPLYESPNVKENYKEIIASVHKGIDRLFLTDQAGAYPSERNQQFATGTIPFPGGLGNATKIPGALSNGMNIAKFKEVINAGQKTVAVAEELGFTAREIGELKRAGSLETAVDGAIERVYNDSMRRASFLKYKYAEDHLIPHAKKFMPEEQARKYIHDVGIKTFPRPKGIPENYRVQISDKGAGMKFVHPKKDGTYIRVMPGKPHSTNPSQQKAYINHRIEGKSVDKFGNFVPNKSPEAHIPIEEFIYRNG